MKICNPGFICALILLPACSFPIQNLDQKQTADPGSAAEPTVNPIDNPARHHHYSDRNVPQGTIIAEPGISPPSPEVLHHPLPYLYCENSNQFVFVYPSPEGEQYYRLRPYMREGYTELFRLVVAGRRHPWALRVHGSDWVLINLEPEVNGRFDLKVHATQFESCGVLSLLADRSADG